MDGGKWEGEFGRECSDGGWDGTADKTKWRLRVKIDIVKQSRFEGFCSLRTRTCREALILTAIIGITPHAQAMDEKPMPKASLAHIRRTPSPIKRAYAKQKKNN